MKNIIFLTFLIFILPIVNAQQTTLEGPGVTPDSFLWGLDKALEQLNLLLTFDEGNEARKGLEIARERLLEIKIMAEENKFEAVEKAKEDHKKTLAKVRNDIKEIEEDNDVEELEDIIEIERGLEDHNEEIEETFAELKVKIKVKGETTQEQKDLIDSILNSLKGQTGEVEIEIENKKDKTKIEIKQKSGKSEEEIEVEIKNIEKEKGIKKEEKALESINDAKAELNEFLEEAKENSLVLSQDLLNKFNSLLGQATIQAEQGNFLEARKLAKQAEELLDEEKEKEIEIEVELEKGRAEISIEFDKEELDFELETTDLEIIINEIAIKTGLSKEEVNKIMKVENEETEEEMKEKKDDKDSDNSDKGGKSNSEDDDNEKDENNDESGKSDEDD